VILSRYLYREITQVAVALLSILILIYLSTRLIRYLGQATAGELPSEFLLQVLAIKLLMVMDVLIPLTFFLAILIALGRLYADQEMTILSACGVGQPFVLRKVMNLSVFVALVTASISLYFTPWAEVRYHKLKQEIHRVANVAGLAAGRFKEFNNGQGVIFVEDVNEDDSSLRNIFTFYHAEKNQIVFAAESGVIRSDPQTGSLYMVMQNGERYEGEPGQAELSRTKFSEYRIRINQGLNHDGEYIPVQAMDSLTLLNEQTPHARAELQKRVSLPLMVLLLLPLAVLLSHTSPRQGRYARVFTAVLLYFTYANLLQVSENWIRREKMSFTMGMWWVHALVLVLIMLLIWRQRRVR
jgi:lipopolysaccharide export system permease protein